MGAGDKRKPFEPVHPHILDVVRGQRFAECAMRSCPHPAVIRKYGVGGEAMVSIYTCKRCKHHIKYDFHGGVGCGYDGVGESVSQGAEG